MECIFFKGLDPRKRVGEELMVRNEEDEDNEDDEDATDEDSEEYVDDEG